MRWNPRCISITFNSLPMPFQTPSTQVLCLYSNSPVKHDFTQITFSSKPKKAKLFIRKNTHQTERTKPCLAMTVNQNWETYSSHSIALWQKTVRHRLITVFFILFVLVFQALKWTNSSFWLLCTATRNTWIAKPVDWSFMTILQNLLTFWLLWMRYRPILSKSLKVFNRTA
jgi:hypothetical protein